MRFLLLLAHPKQCRFIHNARQSAASTHRVIIVDKKFTDSIAESLCVQRQQLPTNRRTQRNGKTILKIYHASSFMVLFSLHLIEASTENKQKAGKNADAE